MRVAIACHWNGDCGGVYPDNIISDPLGFDEPALAYVVRGILDLAGLKFDAEGRLLDPQGP